MIKPFDPHQHKSSQTEEIGEGGVKEREGGTET